MSLVAKAYSPEQIATFIRDYVLGKNVRLTDWNEGSRNLTLAEAVGHVASMTAFAFLDALAKAIPVALYDALGFGRKPAQASSGFFRFYRLPEFYIRYTGAGTAAQITNNATSFDVVVTGAGDSFSLLYSTYPTIAALIAAIDALGTFEAVAVGASGSAHPNTLFYYTGQEIIGQNNFRGAVGRDIMLAPATAVPLGTALIAGVGQQLYVTTAASSIALGDASTPPVPAIAMNAGRNGDLGVRGIDTYDGKGFLQTPVANVAYVVNDTSFVGGSDQESDTERLVRFVEYVNGLNQGTNRAIIAAVKAIANVRSVSLRDPYPAPGFIQVVVDNGTGSLTIDEIALITKVLYGDPLDLENYPGVRPAGVIPTIIAPTIVQVPITASVDRVGTLSDENEIKTAIQSAFELYVNTRILGQDVVLSELIRVGKAAHPAVYDIRIMAPTANVSSGPDELARTGTSYGAPISISVNTLPLEP